MVTCTVLYRFESRNVDNKNTRRHRNAYTATPDDKWLCEFTHPILLLRWIVSGIRLVKKKINKRRKMNISGCVPLDEVWGAAITEKHSPPSHKKVSFKEKMTEQADNVLLMELIREIKEMREEQQRSSNTLWMTVCAGFLLVLLALSSISQTFKRIESLAHKVSWNKMIGQKPEFASFG